MFGSCNLRRTSWRPGRTLYFRNLTCSVEPAIFYTIQQVAKCPQSLTLPAHSLYYFKFVTIFKKNTDDWMIWDASCLVCRRHSVLFTTSNRFTVGCIRYLGNGVILITFHYYNRYALLNNGDTFWKCVVRRFRLCTNVIECTYTNLDSRVYPTIHWVYVV
jgi:hypothetical protein